ncbi:flagellar type III secretion system pore protein FliP [Stieleria sp. JC731]|uniref:flagellar type III secretion system pore protein FliP n=1 Tax=Pirellulaceae TaxID=2691357 RepID=UPI001E3D1567|nr:flagellar type III secretion system pore protein FliP [Stieleria sp. JC731]MCC9602938.1 flagellar type III secretion system pore protein FliP [Stieleria sp. JC731]
MDFLLLSQAAAEPIAGSPEMFSDLAPPLQVAALLGMLSFAVAMLVSVTAFTRIIIVLSFVRRALSTQEIPPNQVMMGLSLFLTLFVMAPTFEKIHQDAVIPLMEAQANQEEGEPPTFGYIDAWQAASEPLKEFMMTNTRTSDLALFFELSDTPPPSQRIDTPMKVAVPAFIISELKTAFIMGFCIYIPFLLIDLVISTILMALGMMMMPPVVVSTPCKLLLFVLVDGWQLISRALVASFA